MAERAAHLIPAVGRVVGIDLGSTRIGIALSDSRRLLASPHTVLERSGDRDADRARLAELVAELEAVLVVIGMPLSLDGSAGPAARAAKQEAEALGSLVDTPVINFDERLTTVEATRRRLETRAQARGEGRPGQSGPRRRQSTRRRAVVDDAAAAILLQAYLDTERG